MFDSLPVSCVKGFPFVMCFVTGAQVCVLAFSTIDRDSFEAVEKWKAKVEDEVGQIVMVLVQNKIDLLDEARVQP